MNEKFVNLDRQLEDLHQGSISVSSVVNVSFEKMTYLYIILLFYYNWFVSCR